jgi:hypothetical protein
MTASIAARQFGGLEATDCARVASDALLRFQEPTGHFRAEHYETPDAPELADMIYTQNWATLGLWHSAQLFDSDEYRRAHLRSLEFLASVQDDSPAPYLRGCWRGLYDTRAGAWGGGDRYEGGANSIYSGWTNAPLAWAFLFSVMDESLFVAAEDSP